jgi:hypothetical protein
MSATMPYSSKSLRKSRAVPGAILLLLASVAGCWRPERYPSRTAPLREVADTVGWQEVSITSELRFRLPPAYRRTFTSHMGRVVREWRVDAKRPAVLQVEATEDDGPPAATITTGEPVMRIAFRQRDRRHWTEPLAADSIQFLAYRWSDLYIRTARLRLECDRWLHLSLSSSDSSAARNFRMIARSVVYTPRIPGCSGG